MLRPVMGRRIRWPASAETHQVASIEVYPNPARDFINIKLPGGTQPDRFGIEIYSLQGSLIYRQFQDQSTINVSSIQPGIYIMRVTTDQSAAFTTKLIISE